MHVATSAAVVLFALQAVSAAIGPKKVIIDTDFLTLPDDGGAIAVANAFMYKGKAEIIGIASNINSSFAIPGIDAINHYYGHRNIFYGQIRPPLDYIDGSTFITGLLDNTRFPRDIQNGFKSPRIQSPVDFYKNLLTNAADKSVTILAIGFLNNLHDFYHSSGGSKLIETKVAELVVQGGDFGPNRRKPGQPNRAGWNLGKNLTAAMVLEDWPSPVTFLGGNIGRRVHTGGILKNTPESNPVRYVYDQFHDRTSGLTHESWDLLATYYGVLGLSDNSFKYGNPGGNGRIKFSEDSTGNVLAQWDYKVTVPKWKQHFLDFNASPAIIANRVDALLALEPPQPRKGATEVRNTQKVLRQQRDMV